VVDGVVGDAVVDVVAADVGVDVATGLPVFDEDITKISTATSPTTATTATTSA
jgi:hypothetical protein